MDEHRQRWKAAAHAVLCWGAALCLAFVSIALAFAATPGSLAGRAAALRAQVGPPSDSLTEDRADFLRRQLLASLERRLDQERALVDLGNHMRRPLPPVPPPASLIALDDLRREQQRLDAELDIGERRRATLAQERDAMARQLSEKVAAQRALADANAAPGEREMASLETELTESAVAEIDLTLRFFDAQRALAQRRHDANARLLADSARRPVAVSAADATALEQRLRTRGDALRRQMAEAAATRARVRAELGALPRNAPPLRVEATTERLTNADMALQFGREALLNLATEQAVYQLALRYYRDHDAAALVEARNNGPMLLARLERRAEVLRGMADQVLARTGALSTELAQAPDAPDAADRRALRDAFEARLRMIESARFDEQRLANLIERLREDLGARVGTTTWPERLRLGWAVVRDALHRFWNFELFTVQRTIEVDGRKTQALSGVTVGKVVKAPLLLVVGLVLATWFTGWGERWLHRRRGVDEGRARLIRRWALALLGAACVLASLAIAGIPLAAFAFIGGAVAIGIGFGMQSLFKNLISGVMVLIERPFRLGDVIEVGALRGTVIDIDLRTSVIRDSDGADTLIPNSVLMEENVKNVTHRTRVVSQSLEVIVDSASDPREVADAMRAAAERHGQVQDAPEPAVSLEAFADNGLRFALHYAIELTPGVDRRRIASDLRLMVLRAFEEAGVKLAPPVTRV